MHENDTSAAAVGKRLRHIRKMAGLKREDLATRAEVGKTSISYWEHATEESSQITSRSMAKILKAIREAGVDCTDRWLRNGSGQPPYIIDKNGAENTASMPLQEKNLIPSLISNMSEEIKLFTSLSDLAVIAKIENACMSPAFEIGDIVGGIWQPSNNLRTEKMCIIKINDELEVRRIKPSTQPGLFHISYLSYDSNQVGPFEVKDLFLEKIAPIIRIWRQ